MSGVKIEGRTCVRREKRGKHCGMMSNKEIGNAIRHELKEAGYSSKQVTVSVKDSGYSTTIRVKVRSPYVNRTEIEELLRHWRDVDVDERTQEILMGGNTYLFVEYTHNVFSEVAEKFAEDASRLMERKEEIVKIYDGLYLMKVRNGFEIRQQNDKAYATRACNFESLCIYLFKFNQFGTISV